MKTPTIEVNFLEQGGENWEQKRKIESHDDVVYVGCPRKLLGICSLRSCQLICVATLILILFILCFSYILFPFLILNKIYY